MTSGCMDVVCGFIVACITQFNQSGFSTSDNNIIYRLTEP